MFGIVVFAVHAGVFKQNCYFHCNFLSFNKINMLFAQGNLLSNIRIQYPIFDRNYSHWSIAESTDSALVVSKVHNGGDCCRNVHSMLFQVVNQNGSYLFCISGAQAGKDLPVYSNHVVRGCLICNIFFGVYQLEKRQTAPKGPYNTAKPV